MIILATIACIIIALPVSILTIEIVAGLFFSSKSSTQLHPSPSATVIIPAHNESTQILPTLSDIKRQLRPIDRLVVIADNCSDDTAAVAENVGAEVIERSDPTQRAKGFALDFGLKYLTANPPDIIVIIDADCRVSENAVQALTQTSIATGRPTQILDLMTAPNDSPLNYHVAEFAWRVKNWVRPLGLRALGLPCQLMGTGMAFPYALLRDANLASGALIEDVKLGLELARAGHPPLFVPSARVTSSFPYSAEGTATQRRRWEEGNIRMILGEAPRHAVIAVTCGNLGLLAMALDLMVPPLSLLILLVTGMAVITGVAAFFGASCVPFTISGLSLAALVAAVALAWFRHGRDVLPLRSIFSVAVYVLGKLPLYARIFSTRKASTWVRTDRGKG